MNKNIEMLMPLFDCVHAVENLIDENNELKEENKKLKERLKWHEESLERNAKASGEAVHDFIRACLDRRITINGDKTIIDPNGNETNEIDNIINNV